MVRSIVLAGLGIVALASACGSGASSTGTATGTGAPSGLSPAPVVTDAGSAPPLVAEAGTDGVSPPPPPPAQACTGKLPQPLDNTWTLSVGGATRTVNLHVPANYDPTKPAPVVLNFHGFTSNASQEDLLAGMSAKADKEGFIAVHPEGLGSPQSWNAGACCGYATQNNVDDIAFVNAILDTAEQLLCVDTHRVFSTGMSNGGFLSQRLGCELSTRIAAIAPVAGVMGMKTCSPSRPVPVMEFHGTADPLVPWGGSTSLGFPSVSDTFAGWGSRDGCTGQPVETFRKGDSHCSTYSACASGTTVTLCTVEGGGHTWPGGLPVPSLGYTTTDLSATDAMWTFFQNNPMP